MEADRHLEAGQPLAAAAPWALAGLVVALGGGAWGWRAGAFGDEPQARPTLVVWALRALAGVSRCASSSSPACGGCRSRG